jgi:hypothetical protein
MNESLVRGGEASFSSLPAVQLVARTRTRAMAKALFALISAEAYR